MHRTFVLALLVACGTSEAPPAADADPAPSAGGAFTPNAAQQAVLAQADAADGTVDHTISQCAVCGLGMEGDPAQAVRTGDYEVHLCSESCKAHYEARTGEVLDNLARVLD